MTHFEVVTLFRFPRSWSRHEFLFRAVRHAAVVRLSVCHKSVFYWNG